jgi:hypothetical protein
MGPIEDDPPAAAKQHEIGFDAVYSAIQPTPTW